MSIVAIRCVLSACGHRLPRRRPSFARGCGFRTGIFHACLMRRLTLRHLPICPQEFDGIDRIELCIEHPMMRLTHEREIIRIVVIRPLIEMGNREACRNLQPAHDAASEGICLICIASCLGLISAGRRQWRIYSHDLASPVDGMRAFSMCRKLSPLDRQISVHLMTRNTPLDSAGR